MIRLWDLRLVIATERWCCFLEVIELAALVTLRLRLVLKHSNNIQTHSARHLPGANPAWSRLLGSLRRHFRCRYQHPCQTCSQVIRNQGFTTLLYSSHNVVLGTSCCAMPHAKLGHEMEFISVIIFLIYLNRDSRHVCTINRSGPDNLIKRRDEV